MAQAPLSMFIALAALAPAWAPRAAAAPGAQCPRVTVSCPEGAVVGQPVEFAVNVAGGDASWKLTYTWVVSAGVILGGRHSPGIKVDTTGLTAATVEATVEVGGLPASCAKSASCSTPVPPLCILARKIDEYFTINFEDEKARLDNLAAEMRNDPAALAYVIAYGGRRGRAGEARRRADRVRDYLANARALDPQRVVTIDGGYREEAAVELYLTPAGSPPPAASPTVDPSEVEIVPEGPAPVRPARKPRRRN